MICFLLFVLAVWCRLQFRVNEEVQYSLNGKTMTFGSDDTPHYVSLTATLNVTCISDEVGGEYYGFMVTLNDLKYQSVNDGMDPYYANVSGQVGDEFYFRQTYDGMIFTVSHMLNDEPTMSNLKMQIVNVLQTYDSVDEAGEFHATQGKYTASMTRSDLPDSSYQLRHEYDQSHFNEHSDPRISTLEDPDAFKYNGISTHTLKNGKIIRADIVHASKYHDESAEIDQGYISSRGDLSLSLMSTRIVEKPYRIRDMDDPRMIQGCLFEHGKRIMEFVNGGGLIENATFILTRDLERLFGSGLSILPDVNDALKMCREIVTILVDYDSNFDPIFAQQYLNLVKFHTYNTTQKDYIFYILTLDGSPEAQEYIKALGFLSNATDVMVMSLLAMSHLENPTDKTIEHLKKISESSDVFEKEVRTIALLALSATAKPNAAMREYFINRVMQEEDGSEELLPLYHAVQNFIEGLLFIPGGFVEKLMTNKEVEGMVSSLSQSSKSESSNGGTSNGDPFAPYYKDMPNNKHSYIKRQKGGKYVSAEFQAGYFLGSGNGFFCQDQKTFNYLGYALMEAHAQLFSKKKSIINAYVVYGKDHGKLVGNSIYLSLMGKTLYHKTLATLNCKTHKKSLYHTSPGFSVGYTVVIVFVPVRFSISLDIQINLDWEWNICDSTVYADTGLVPSVSLVVAGHAGINLLAIEGGVKLSVTFKVSIEPKVYVSGKKCEFGIDVNLQIIPFTFKFGIYYKVIWHKEHSKTLFSWSAKAYNKNIWHRAYKIPVHWGEEDEESRPKIGYK